jgi:hypothetical protein
MIFRQTRHRSLLATGAVLLATSAGIALSVVAAAPQAPGSTVATEAAPAALEVGARPSISDDGRWMVYQGRPTDGSTRTATVYLRDLAAGPNANPVSELTNLGAAGNGNNSVGPGAVRLGDSVRPVISGDGCSVVVVTQMAFDLFRDDDTGDRWDVYRTVLPRCGGKAGEWELVSTRSADTGETSAADAVDPTDTPAVSRTGAIVAYTRRAASVGGARSDAQGDGATRNRTQVDVVDLGEVAGAVGRDVAVAGTPPGAPDTTFRYLGQRHPSLSADGRLVAFASDALSDQASPTWATGPTPGGFATSQVYVWDRQASTSSEVGATGPAVRLVSANKGVAAAGGADAPVISGSGRYVAFASSSADLAGDATLPSCAQQCPTQIYRVDLTPEATTPAAATPDAATPAAGAPEAGGALGPVLVSRTASAPGQPVVAADAGGSQPFISADGSQVGFVTRSTTLFPIRSAAGSEPDDGDIAIATVDLGTIRRISVEADGATPLPATNAHPAMTASGHVVVFDTLAAGQLGASGVAAGAGVTSGAVAGGRQAVAVTRPAQVSAAALDVGTVDVGFAGAEWFVAVRNDGPSTFMPATVVSSNPQFALTGGTCVAGAAVPPGGSCTVNVTLTPAAIGPVAGTITVAESLVGGASTSVAVAGAGGVPSLTATPSGADFARTAVGATSAPISVDIGNLAFTPVTVTGIAVAGTNPDDFTVVSSSCLGRAINPNTTCSLDLAFAPKAAGYRTASVLVSVDGGPYTSVFVDGMGALDTRLAVASARVRVGDPVGIGGSGFAPGATVTISWADGRGPSTSVVADATGQFMAAITTRPNDRVGARVLVAQSGDSSASAAVQLLPRRKGSPTGIPL